MTMNSILGDQFISFEGVDGSGKSSVLAVIADWLETTYSLPITCSREPGGTEVGEHIRELLLSDKMANCLPQTELLLMFAARYEHVQKIIKPALEEGHWVLVDRFSDASFAYQGIAMADDWQMIEKLCQLTHPNLWPNLTFWFDVDITTAMQRTTKRLDTQEANRLDKQQYEWYQQVSNNYQKRADAFPDRIIRIDASAPFTEVCDNIKQILESRIKSHT